MFALVGFDHSAPAGESRPRRYHQNNTASHFAKSRDQQQLIPTLAVKNDLRIEILAIFGVELTVLSENSSALGLILCFESRSVHSQQDEVNFYYLCRFTPVSGDLSLLQLKHFLVRDY